MVELLPDAERVPENRPTPIPALLSDVTPIDEHYRRNHYPYPLIDAHSWRLRVTGAVHRALDVGLADLAALPQRETAALLECAGHRRTEFSPPISGVQWGLGALSQAQWGGVALRSVLSLCEPLDDAIEVVFHGADAGPFSGLPGTHTFSRAIPLEKALHPDTLLATTMNGGPLPREHGAPTRAIVPGWYAMDSVKWIQSIEVVTTPFRGPYQELDYRFQPLGDTSIGARISEMPVHSLFASPADGDAVPSGPVEVRGIAWAGAGVDAVEVRVDNGSWEPARLVKAGPYERVVWSLTLDLGPGQRALAVRATDSLGRCQPEAPVWNKRGYVNHSIQRISVLATSP